MSLNTPDYWDRLEYQVLNCPDDLKRELDLLSEELNDGSDPDHQDALCQYLKTRILDIEDVSPSITYGIKITKAARQAIADYGGRYEH